MHSNCCIAFLGFFILTTAVALEKNYKKRQIYREQVLPHAGGRIPDSAFQSDRLYLNRLQKEGIAVPDGIVTKQRNPQVYPLLAKSRREVYRVALTADNPHPAHHHHARPPPSIETTYLYPQIHAQPAKTPTNPIRTETQLPRRPQLINRDEVQIDPIFSIHPIVDTRNDQKYLKIQSYQNFNIENGSSDDGGYVPDDPSTQIFNDFNHLFGNLDLRGSIGKKLGGCTLRYTNF